MNQLHSQEEVAEETLQHIFEPFYTTRRSTGGSGPGLYIVYNLVTQGLHGTIHCDSAIGKGTRFFMMYPYCSDRQDAAS